MTEETAPERRQAERDERAVENIAVRRANVAVANLAKATQREMAAQFGVALSTINSDVQAIREQWAAQAGRAYSTHVAEELAKFDALERSLMRKAIGSDPDMDAVKLMLQISRSRRQLLGLNAPTRSELLIGVVDTEAQRARAMELLEHVRELEPDGTIDV